MGLSNFPSAAEGVLPVLVMNTVVSVAMLKNMVRSVLQVVGGSGDSPNLEEEEEGPYGYQLDNQRERRISVTQYKSLCHNNTSCDSTTSDTDGGTFGFAPVECCVCLCKFEADEEVGELSCKHFFHKGCLERWFDNKHTTCPLCRSID